MDCLSTLPDELILEIFSHLRPAKKYRQATKGKELYSPSIGGKVSMKTFHALCLTSKRIAGIATPELYASLSTDHRDNSLESFLNYTTIIANRPFLGHHLEYIRHSFDWSHSDFEWPYASHVADNKWSVHRNSLQLAASKIWSEDKLHIWSRLYQLHPEQASLVLLLALAPNISHIVVDIFEGALPSIIALLDLDSLSDSSQSCNIHSFKQLKTLLYYSRSNFSDDDFPPQADYYISQLQSLQAFPSLSPYQHSAARLTSKYDGVMYAQLRLPSITKLELMECNLNTNGVAAMIEASGALEHFSFVPTGATELYDYPKLYPALRSKRATLKSIKLSVGYWFFGSIVEKPMGTFSDFFRLEKLYILDIFLMGIPDGCQPNTLTEYKWTNSRPITPLIDFLHAELESLELASEFTRFSDDTDFLWDFIKSLDRLPRLRSFSAGSNYQESLVKLSEALLKHSVEFTSK